MSGRRLGALLWEQLTLQWSHGLLFGLCLCFAQAFSHRMKGLGMSTFDPAEVDALARTSNARQAAVWLGKLTREQICAMAPAATASPQVRRRLSLA